jgi:hypothetical protein
VAFAPAGPEADLDLGRTLEWVAPRAASSPLGPWLGLNPDGTDNNITDACDGAEDGAGDAMRSPVEHAPSLPPLPRGPSESELLSAVSRNAPASGVATDTSPAERLSYDGQTGALRAHAAHESLGPAHTATPDGSRPLFHVAPESGWGSDPNGPIFYKGRYHL